MAGRRIHEEEIRLDIVINNSQAQRDLFELERKTKDLVNTNKDLKRERASLEAQGKRNTQEYRNLTAEINRNTAQISNNRSEMNRLQNEIGVTGLTMAQLSRRANELRYSLRNMVPGSREWNDLNNQLQETNARIRQLNSTSQAQRLSFGQAADWLNRYQTMIVSVAATITGLTYSIQKWLDYNGKLADANSNVMKVTGFTQQQIEKLNESLGKINTRTSRVELLGLAEQAGRLGKTSIKEVEGFVEVANRLKVALGDDLAEEQIQDVGKLVTTYRVGTETGKDFNGAMEALGSAINEVSASGANQASYLVDYMNRMAGVAAQAKLSASDNLGYAATFDELGQSAEVTGTAMNKILLDMFKNPGDYAKIAGMSVQGFNKILNEDSNQAMIKFLEGLNGNAAGLQQMVVKMEDLDAGGTRGVAAISALAGNLDILRSRQQTANLSMQEATSLTNEYNIKNNNLAALLDKIKKTTAGWFSSDTLVAWLTTCVTWFAKLIGATEDADHSGARWRNNLLVITKVIVTLVAGLISYKTALQLTALWTNRNTAGSILYNAQIKLQNILAAIAIVKTELYAAAQLLLAGNVRGAIAQIRVLNAVLFASPWGVVLGLVTAVTTAYFLFSDSAENAYDKQKMLNNVNVEASKSIVSQQLELSKLINIAKDETRSKEERLLAIKKLNEISPQYLGQLNLENINTAKGTAIINQNTEALYKNARAKALQGKYEELVKERIDEKNKDSNDYKDGWENGFGIVSKGFDAIFGKTKGLKDYNDVLNWVETNESKIHKTRESREKRALALYKQLGLERKHLKIAQIDAQLIDVEGELKEIDTPLKSDNPQTSTDYSNITTATNASKGKNTAGNTDAQRQAEKDKSTRDKYFEDLKKETEKNQEEILKIQREYEDLGLNSIENKFERERSILSAEHQRKIDDLRAQLVDEETLKTLDEQKKKATAKGDTGLVTRIDEMKKTFLIKNAEINDLITQQTKTYQENLLKIGREYQLSEVDKLIETGNKKITEQKRLQTAELATISSVEDAKDVLRRTMSEEELKKIKTWQQAKTAIEAQYEQETLDAQQKFLEEQLSLLHNISQGDTTTGIDFNLLTPEQQENFKKQCEELKVQIDELIIKKNDLMGQNKDKKDGNKGNSGDDGNSKGSLNKYSTDIFGMSPDDWQTLFTNLEQGKVGFEEIAAVIGVMQQMYAQYSQMVAANENRELQKFEDRTNRKKDALSRQLDQGYINQATYNAEVQKLEEAYNKKKAETEYKQAKREKQMALVSALMGTAGAVVGALGAKPWTPANYALAAIVGALGAVQVGMIAAQPLPSKGFESGYINIQREQDGKFFKAKQGGVAKTGLVSQPTHFLAGEQGSQFPEMIIDGPTWKGMSPDIKQALQNDILRVKGFQDGSYQNIASTDKTEFIAFLKLNYNVLLKLQEEGLDARVVNDYRNSSAILKGIDKVNKFKSKTIQ